MEFTKDNLIELSNKTNFIKDNLEKVLRLSEILRFLNSDFRFKGLLALKGGTAINLIAVELPRLSVDIDLDFTKNLPKEEIELMKEEITKNLAKYMIREGYSLDINPRKHYALLSFAFSYINNANNKDNIKIEINFMDRCHVLPLDNKRVLPSDILGDFYVLSLNIVELYASKINALLSRATPRDLYDVNKMIENDVIKDKNLLRKCLIFYNMVGGEQDIDNLNFEKIEKIDFQKFKKQLKPVISKDDKFILEKAKSNVIEYLKKFVVLTDKENNFINEFKKNNYLPELLFDDSNIVNEIKNHPMAIWRCLNDD